MTKEGDALKISDVTRIVVPILLALFAFGWNLSGRLTAVETMLAVVVQRLGGDIQAANGRDTRRGEPAITVAKPVDVSRDWSSDVQGTPKGG